MPQFTQPSSGSTSETGDMNGPAGQGPQGNGQPQGQLAGEIMLSKAESAALTAIHFGAKDPRKALERARRESGLSHNQVTRLKSRADHARSQGMTLKGDRLVLKPTKLAAPDEPGLLRDDVTGKDDAEAKAAEKAAKTTAKKETPGTMRRSYAGRKVADAAPAKKKTAA